MRYHILDNIRGACLVSMFIYHGMYDLVNIFGLQLDWFPGPWEHAWQQSICWTFILLSGFCWGLGSHPVRRGLVVSAAGLLVTAVTAVFMPEELVVFGILTFLGAAMILLAPFKKLLEKAPALPAAAICAVLFVLLRDVNWGWIGFESFHIVPLPDWLYANMLTTAIGFQTTDFFSTDYFALIPWIFLYLVGYFGFRALSCPPTPAAASTHAGFVDKSHRRPQLHIPTQKQVPVLNFLGRHSLVAYLVHQPVIFGLLYLASMAL